MESLLETVRGSEVEQMDMCDGVTKLAISGDSSCLFRDIRSFHKNRCLTEYVCVITFRVGKFHSSIRGCVFVFQRFYGAKTKISFVVDVVICILKDCLFATLGPVCPFWLQKAVRVILSSIGTRAVLLRGAGVVLEV